MDKPTVSVLMPVYNAAPFLKDAIESVLTQSFEKIEFIIIDDCSTDGSYDVLEEYGRRDPRVRICRNSRNMGIVYSLNKGIGLCRGDYIARMDADDISLKDRISLQVAALEADREIAALGTALRYIDSSGKDLGVTRRCFLESPYLSRTPLLHPTVMLRRELLDRYGLRYLERYRYAEDYYLWLQLARVGKLSAIDSVLLQYRITPTATRFKELKGVIRATLRAKRDAVFVLKMKPGLKDMLVYLAESALLLLPSRFVIFVYLRLLFAHKTKGCL
ncbi:MAG: glycosyltransferase [Candidatus Omnitrophica bacterium]|nr:glycosyltransferase [Candidatus Omnitrophota bacterium]